MIELWICNRYHFCEKSLFGIHKVPIKLTCYTRDNILTGGANMPLQTKRTDELSKQFDDLFVMPDVKDDNKDRFLGKKDEEQLKR